MQTIYFTVAENPGVNFIATLDSELKITSHSQSSTLTATERGDSANLFRLIKLYAKYPGYKIQANFSDSCLSFRWYEISGDKSIAIRLENKRPIPVDFLVLIDGQPRSVNMLFDEKYVTVRVGDYEVKLVETDGVLTGGGLICGHKLSVENLYNCFHNYISGKFKVSNSNYIENNNLYMGFWWVDTSKCEELILILSSLEQTRKKLANLHM